jgi:hypothetical protein
MLKIYWGTNNIKIVEPSGKIHQSDINNMIGKNLLDLMFLKKYIGQKIEIHMDHASSMPPVATLTTVGINECGVHYFEVL